MRTYRTGWRRAHSVIAARGAGLKRADFVAPLWDTARNLGDDDLGDTVARWLRRLSERYNLNLPGMEELLAMQDVTVLTSRLDETIEEWRREAVASGHAEGKGHAEGIVRQRAMLKRLAARRFGPQCAEEVGLLLEEVNDWEQLAIVGESILDANEGDELKDRVTALLREP